jgi:hypothetical protein
MFLPKVNNKDVIMGKLAKLHAAFEESLANCKDATIAAR